MCFRANRWPCSYVCVKSCLTFFYLQAGSMLAPRIRKQHLIKYDKSKNINFLRSIEFPNSIGRIPNFVDGHPAGERGGGVGWY